MRKPKSSSNVLTESDLKIFADSGGVRQSKLRALISNWDGRVIHENIDKIFDNNKNKKKRLKSKDGEKKKRKSIQRELNNSKDDDRQDEKYSHRSRPRTRRRSIIMNSSDSNEDNSNDSGKASKSKASKKGKKKIQNSTNSKFKFEYILKNVYIGKKSLPDSNAEEHICTCTVPFGKIDENQVFCGDNCVNRMLNIECDRKLCPCGDRCSNQRFQKRQWANVEIRDCGLKGQGLFTKEKLKKGQFVIEYIGEICDEETYQARMLEYDGERHFYFLSLDAQHVIDASRKGNKGRFINHSCNPNCELQKWLVNGENRVGIFAIKDIPANTELTFDYAMEVYGLKRQKCYCGEPNCRGSIKSKDKELKVLTAEQMEQIENAKMKKKMRQVTRNTIKYQDELRVSYNLQVAAYDSKLFLIRNIRKGWLQRVTDLIIAQNYYESDTEDSDGAVDEFGLTARERKKQLERYEALQKMHQPTSTRSIRSSANLTLAKKRDNVTTSNTSAIRRWNKDPSRHNSATNDKRRKVEDENSDKSDSESSDREEKPRHRARVYRRRRRRIRREDRESSSEKEINESEEIESEEIESDSKEHSKKQKKTTSKTETDQRKAFPKKRKRADVSSDEYSDEEREQTKPTYITKKARTNNSRDSSEKVENSERQVEQSKGSHKRRFMRNKLVASDSATEEEKEEISKKKTNKKNEVAKLNPSTRKGKAAGSKKVRNEKNVIAKETSKKELKTPDKNLATAKKGTAISNNIKSAAPLKGTGLFAILDKSKHKQLPTTNNVKKVAANQNNFSVGNNGNSSVNGSSKKRTIENVTSKSITLSKKQKQ
jgi:hypothetical protein